jgi:hypothetical protein
MNTDVYLSPYLAHFFLECDISQARVAEKIEKHVLCLITFFKIMSFIIWKNCVAPKRPQITIWRTRIAFWTPKTTKTHTEYVILTAFPQQQWLHESVSMLRYMSTACLGLYKLCSERYYRPQINHWATYVRNVRVSCLSVFNSNWNFPTNVYFSTLVRKCKKMSQQFTSCYMPTARHNVANNSTF